MIYGIDIGGTKIETAVFNDDMSLLTSWRVPTPTKSYQDFLEKIAEQVAKADEQSKGAGAIGVGMPGLIDPSNRSLCANIPCAIGKNVRKDVENLVKRNVVLENDCRCFALSEANLGAGQNFDKVYGAIIGTGAAGGLCISGKLFNGPNKVVGEYGHIPLPAHLQKKYDLPLIQCGCGLMGCMENYISGTGLSKLYAHYFGRKLTAEEIIEETGKGVAKAEEIYTVFMNLLGFTFASIIQSYDPEIIVLGGGMSKTKDLCVDLTHAITPYLFSTVSPPPIVRAAFGDSSGVRGAAILAKQNIGATLL